MGIGEEGGEAKERDEELGLVCKMKSKRFNKKHENSNSMCNHYL